MLFLLANIQTNEYGLRLRFRVFFPLSSDLIISSCRKYCTLLLFLSLMIVRDISLNLLLLSSTSCLLSGLLEYCFFFSLWPFCYY